MANTWAVSACMPMIRFAIKSINWFKENAAIKAAMNLGMVLRFVFDWSKTNILLSIKAATRATP